MSLLLLLGTDRQRGQGAAWRACQEVPTVVDACVVRQGAPLPGERLGTLDHGVVDRSVVVLFGVEPADLIAVDLELVLIKVLTVVLLFRARTITFLRLLRSCCITCILLRSCCIAGILLRSCCITGILLRSCCIAGILLRRCCITCILLRSCCIAGILLRRGCSLERGCRLILQLIEYIFAMDVISNVQVARCSIEEVHRCCSGIDTAISRQLDGARVLIDRPTILALLEPFVASLLGLFGSHLESSGVGQRGLMRSVPIAREMAARASERTRLSE